MNIYIKNKKKIGSKYLNKKKILKKNKNIWKSVVQFVPKLKIILKDFFLKFHKK